MVPRPEVEVRYSSLDVKAARPMSLVAPAMVAVYGIDDQGYTTFDDELSAQARDRINTLLEYRASAPILELKRVDATPLVAAEFYNRMDRVTTDTTNYCLHNHVCTEQPFWFGLQLTRKLASWEGPLGVRYVVFLRIVGVHRPQPTFPVPVTLLTGGGIIPAALLFALSAVSGYAGPDGAVACAAVVDLAEARIVWFKIKPIAHSRSIPEMSRAIEELLRDLS